MAERDAGFLQRGVDPLRGEAERQSEQLARAACCHRNTVGNALHR